jgi:hypothetical protein
MTEPRRICGKRCHDAKCRSCRCWCGGMFHGAGGAEARASFASTFDVDKVPTMERDFLAITGQPSLFDGDPAVHDEWRIAYRARREG